MPIEIACRTCRSASCGEEPLMVMCRKFGPPACRISTFGIAWTCRYVVASGPTSIRLMSPLASACPWAVWSTTRNTIELSLGFWPHQFGFGLSVYVCAAVSWLANMNGPAVVSGCFTQPLLNVFGLLLVDAG